MVTWRTVAGRHPHDGGGIGWPATAVVVVVVGVANRHSRSASLTYKTDQMLMNTMLLRPRYLRHGGPFSKAKLLLRKQIPQIG